MDTTGWTYRTNTSGDNWAGDGEVVDATGRVVLRDGDEVTGPGNRDFLVSQVWAEDGDLWVEGHYAGHREDDVANEVLRVSDLEALQVR
jgi:hypothetical protein